MKQALAFDFETSLIQPGLLAPPAVCLTWQRPGLPSKIKHWSDAEPILRDWLEDPTVLLVGANVAYDMGVVCANYPKLLPLVFKKYEDNLVSDCQLRQKLLDIAGGVYRGYINDSVWVKRNYSLFDLARRHTGRILKKEGTRLFYQFFRDVPLSKWVEHYNHMQTEWEDKDPHDLDLTEEQIKELPGFLAGNPSEVLSYPLEDAEATLEVFQAQEKHKDFLEDQFRQSRAAWWLHLMSAWGTITDPGAVHELRAKTEEAYAEVQARLLFYGMVRSNGSRDTKRAKEIMIGACERANIPLRMTAANQICLDSDACKATEDRAMIDYAEFSTLSKVLSADIPMLERGNVVPIQPRYDLADTGRTTCSKPNIQNLRRLKGIREAFVPRPGKVFAQADYAGLELHTLAQVCITLFGRSLLGESLNAGRDPHMEVACRILGISYEEGKANKKRPDVDNARQTGKVANFGFPGGLGAARLCYFAKKTYDVDLTEEKAKELKRIWLSIYPEMQDYFGHVNALPESSLGRTAEQLYVKRYRGGASYTAACNGYFQGLGADCAKEAGWLIAKACYSEPSSPLFGSRPVLFVHDEFVLECSPEVGHEVAEELGRLMILGAGKYLVDVPPKVEPCLMTFYSKAAVPVYGEGRLVPWRG